MKIKNVSKMSIQLLDSNSYQYIEIKPKEELEIDSLEDFINLKGLIDPSKRLIIVTL